MELEELEPAFYLKAGGAERLVTDVAQSLVSGYEVEQGLFGLVDS